MKFALLFLATILFVGFVGIPHFPHFVVLAQDAKSPVPDDHISLCHADFLRFYRYRTTHVDAEGRSIQMWSGWHLIVSKPEDAKTEIDKDLAWFREAGIEVQYHSIEGKLPE